MIQISAAASSGQIADAARLFREYGAIPGIEVCLDSFEEEIGALPGPYAPPSGSLLLATEDGRPAGVVGVRAIAPDVAEMKRLFLRPELRGGGRGRALAVAAVEEARRLGFTRLRLETLPGIMKEAVSLYRSLGFVEIPACGDACAPGSLRMELFLT